MLKGCEVKAFEVKDKSFTFAIVCENTNPLIMQADSENLMKMWMTAIKNSSIGIYGLSKRTDFAEFYEVLGIPVDSRTDLSQNQLNRFYRKAALSTHPDKGGDPKKV